MKKLKQLTVGIPALNEEKSIGVLLSSLISQKEKGFRIVKIIVISDGSTDSTVSTAKRIKDRRIEVIQKKKRLGKASRLNQIINKTDSDLLVLVDADISIASQDFISELVTPIINQKADMTSPAIQELSSKTFFEEVLDLSMKLKIILFSKFKNGNNVYNCHGPARAFNKSLYKKINFQNSEGDDMFSYLFCIKNNYKFRFIPNIYVSYRLPSVIKDHYKQSSRYLNAIEFCNSFFGKNLVNSEFAIPRSVFLCSFLSSIPLLFRMPIHSIFYLSTFSLVRIARKLNIKPNEYWQVKSSKNI
ncbi:glycosyltransferase family 2 protein [Candidatus Woesebacteria bacterium]|nr:glycosyltransferase family 2 protein [Candidatus Woesebacteria bacterium]QQG47191.1 MAG: glycosyltransferase family 2 protein [Candidatus Woesebacteria bacterium]